MTEATENLIRTRTSKCYDHYRKAIKRLVRANHKRWRKGKPILTVIPESLVSARGSDSQDPV